MPRSRSGLQRAEHRTPRDAGARGEHGVAVGGVLHGHSRTVRVLLLSLEDNAVKYPRPEGHVTIRLTVTGEAAVLRVADTGIGIAAQDVPRIFDRLFRTDAADRSTKGAGLGLAIVKRIVEAHRGTITVDSAPGVGSTFTVTLPRARRE
ncbi:MAG: ATP-binding protein [Gemmatimonadetes bacterium]|nr:ATP-binding protein [Gemmatimonadota bacterium]